MILDKAYKTSKNQDEAFLEKLVNIESQTKNLSGNKKVLKVIENKLKDIQFSTKYIKSTNNDGRSLLIAERKSSRVSALSISFIGHSDVVTKPQDHKFEISFERIGGSGVADNKGGIVLALSAVKEFFSKINILNINITIVISPSEETGSIGFHDYFKDIGEKSDYVVGLEPALSCGSLIGSRSGNRWYCMKSNGISAHSGRFGQSYVNAAHQLSLLIAKLHELNSEVKKRRVNVGGFQTSLNTYNTICSSATAKVDTRFSSFECRDEIHTEINKIIKLSVLTCPYTKNSGAIYYSVEDDCPPMQSTTSLWLDSYLNTVASLEKNEAKITHSGGAADINYFSHSNSLLIDGMGPVAGGLHTRHEYIERNSLKTRKNALVILLMSINENNNRRVLWN